MIRTPQLPYGYIGQKTRARSQQPQAAQPQMTPIDGVSELLRILKQHEDSQAQLQNAMRALDDEQRQIQSQQMPQMPAQPTGLPQGALKAGALGAGIAALLGAREPYVQQGLSSFLGLEQNKQQANYENALAAAQQALRNRSAQLDNVSDRRKSLASQYEAGGKGIVDIASKLGDLSSKQQDRDWERTKLGMQLADNQAGREWGDLPAKAARYAAAGLDPALAYSSEANALFNLQASQAKLPGELQKQQLENQGLDFANRKLGIDVSFLPQQYRAEIARSAAQVAESTARTKQITQDVENGGDIGKIKAQALISEQLNHQRANESFANSVRGGMVEIDKQINALRAAHAKAAATLTGPELEAETEAFNQQLSSLGVQRSKLRDQVQAYEKAAVSDSLKNLYIATGAAIKQAGFENGKKCTDKTDCSLFAQRVFNAAGIKTSSTTATQKNEGTPVDWTKQPLMPLDQVFIGKPGKNVSHTLVYIGNGKYAHASVSGKNGSSRNKGLEYTYKIVNDIQSYLKSVGMEIKTVRRRIGK